MYLNPKRFSLLAVLLSATVVSAAFGQTAAETAYRAANDLMVDERWAEAQAAFERFVAANRSHELADDAAFWACFSREQRSAVSEETFKCYESFLASYGSSRYADDARANMLVVAQGLARGGNPKYEAYIKSMRSNGDQEVAMAALYALGDMGDAEAVETLRRLYSQADDPAMRRKIVHVLADAETPEVFNHLREIAMSDASVDVAKAAVYALSDFDDEQAVSTALSSVLDSDRPVEVRKAALYALADVETTASLERLTAVALSDTDPELTKAATYALGDLEVTGVAASLQRILRNARSTETKKAALYALADHDDASVVTTLSAAARDLTDPELQKAAVYALGDIEQPGVVAALQAIYRSTTASEVKKAVMYSLADTEGGDAGAARTFLGEVAMSNTDVEAAKAAVYALEDMTSGDTSVLLNILRNAPLLEVRKAALYQIADDPSEEATRTLADVLSDDASVELRKAAAYALAETGSDAVVPALVQAARSDASTEVRKAAVRALGEIGTEAAENALLQIISGGN